MNYSIILLGATISLSLFLRICNVCEAMEVNTDPGYFDKSSLFREIAGDNDILYGWLIDDRTYGLRSEYKKILHSQDSKSSIGDSSYDLIDNFVDSLFLDLRTYPRPPVKPKGQKFVWHDGLFDELCGAKVRNESHDGTIQDVVEPGSKIEGCKYKDGEISYLVCDGKNLTEIPPLPQRLSQLDFVQTQIKELHIQDFGNVAINHIRFFGNALTTVDVWAFEKIEGLQSLTIVNNEIEYLAYEIYVGLTNVTMLTLDNNLISLDIYQQCEERPIDDIQPVLPQLRAFSLAGNPLKIIPSQMWAGLRYSPVNLLNLDSCQLEYIDPVALSFLPNLTTLFLSSNPKLMPSLEDAFEGLRGSSLSKLTLVDNQLTDIPGNALAILAKSLNTLDLSSNAFEYVSTNNFPVEMSNLRDLSLDNCKIRSIAPGSLEMLPNLVSLSIKNNRLSEVPPSIPSLRSLTRLLLDNNYLEDGVGRTSKFVIPPAIFENSSSISILSLNNLKIGKITSQTFVGLSKLSTLMLEYAEIESIEDLSFRDLASLKSLVIRNNPIQTINSLTFYGMASLEGLYISNCSLTFPVPGPFEEFAEEETTDVSTKMLIKPEIPEVKNLSTPFEFLASLRWLELGYNNIDTLYPGLFDIATNLTLIDLTGNKITSWNTPIFRSSYLPGFQDTANRRILLSGNKLSYITDVMIKDILNFLPYIVDMTNNPFICDIGTCKLRDMLVLPENSTQEEGQTTQWPAEYDEVLRNLNWTDIEGYECVHTDQKHYPIVNLSDKLCKDFGNLAQNPTDESDGAEGPSKPSSIVTISVGIVCVTGLIAAAVVVGYKKRVHLKYAWFVAKINIGKIPRKSKTSIAEVVQYDYDIFISYHNSDRDFVQDEFLPEVEDSPENDKSKDVEEGRGRGFRVCLHERDFEAGVPISENIVECVDRSKKVVIIISKKYLESQWCTYEMNLAYHRLIDSRRSSFVLVFLEEVPPELRTKVLNYLMRSKTFLEWPGNDASVNDKKRFWSRLTGSLSSSDC